MNKSIAFFKDKYRSLKNLKENLIGKLEEQHFK